jgi:hypothetical protein
MISTVPDLSSGRSDPAFPALKIVPDKFIEDAIAGATGERQAYSGEPDYSVLWTNDGKALAPAAIWLRTNEPLLMNTILPKIGSITGVDGAKTSSLLAEGDAPVWGPKVGNDGHLPAGIEKFIVAESGLAALLILNDVAGTRDLEVTLKRQWSWQQGDKVAEEKTLLKVPAGKLKAQVAKLSPKTRGL